MNALAPTLAVTELGSSKERPYRELRMIHRRVIALHLQGHSHNEIAFTLQMHPATVARILRNPTSRQVISAALDTYEQEISALFPQALEALREVVRQGQHKDKLAAAKTILELNGKFETRKTGDSAEDVVRRVMEIHTDGPATIRVGEERHES